MLFALRVTSGQEKVVAEMIYNKVRKQPAPIYSIAVFDGLKGYIIVESDKSSTIKNVVKGLSHIRGILDKKVDIKEIADLIEAAKSPIAKISKSDIVEIISGPFKGEKAMVKRLDESKDEITVELVEAAVPIPVTIKVDMVKLFKKSDENI
ncbi:transcription elongation factor Spt5 [Candidatus Micrarchaeota archaeon]|nr:transcription elongation factor Spt5 [Candidatus Micrarchaeota archaeon]